MKSVFALALLAASVAAQSFQVNTPVGATGAIQCAAYQITWTGGVAPFDVRLFDPSLTLVEEIAPSVQSSPFQWTVNEPAGQQFSFAVRDSTGNTAQSAPFIIQGSSNSACLTATPSASGGSATGAPSATAPGASSVAAGTTTPAGSTGGASTGGSSATSKAPSASGASSSAAPSASQTPSSAMNAIPNAGFLGALVAAAAALF